MIHQLRSVWSGYVIPMFQRPARLQVAALCHRGVGVDLRILLVTSRDTGRWVLPKGWPIRGLDAPGAAMQEAWEEAGVRGGTPWNEPIGTYIYEKMISEGWGVTVRTLVFPVAVAELEDDYPESDQRRRVWVTPQDAAEMVNEPELKEILSQCDTRL